MIQYAAFWLADEIHTLPRQAAFSALLREISDEAFGKGCYLRSATMSSMTSATR
jgi:capsule polysaccharide export protein KpsC/LpsZ